MSTHPSFNNEPLMQILHESLKTTPHKGVLQGIRKLTKGRSGKRIVFFPSKINNAFMPCESRLEADGCLHLEFNKCVETYRTQPFTIDLGGNNSYTPDSIHRDHYGNLVVSEVKFSGALKNQELQSRLNKIRNILSLLGVDFHVLTEKHLQLPPKVNNYSFLYRCSHQTYDQMLIDYAIGLLDKLPNPCSLKEFRSRCHRSNLPPLVADTLLFLGIVSYDQSKILNSESLVWKTGGES